VHPKAIEAMKEIGIDISGHTSKHMNEFLDRKVDTVITVAATPIKPAPCFPDR
jgi:arsenate reductase